MVPNSSRCLFYNAYNYIPIQVSLYIVLLKTRFKDLLNFINIKINFQQLQAFYPDDISYLVEDY